MKDPLVFLEKEYVLLECCEDASFATRHEDFCLRLGALPSGEFERLDGDQKTFWAEKWIRLQRRYLAHKESEAAEAIMKSPILRGGNPTEAMLTSFGLASYNRVVDLARALKDRPFRRVVMVGCGALPATLFWLHDHFPGLDSVGLDVDRASLERAAGLAGFLGIQGACFKHADGCHYDYSHADFVYVANQVSPKRKVLERIAETVGRPIPVVVRDPAGLGWLLAETAAPEFPRGFRLVGEGPVSGAFLSKDLFLQFEPWQGA